MKLSDYYRALLRTTPTRSGNSRPAFGGNDIANWLGTHYPSLTRRQCCAIARILWGWVMLGYAPASVIQKGF